MRYPISDTCQIKDLHIIYKQLFGASKTKGTFVEVGAFDGESYSNTSGLADLGWTGVYIEPISDYAQVCSERHAKNDVKVICCAAGLENKLIDIYCGLALTTTKKEMVEVYSQIEWAAGHHEGEKRTVPQRTLEYLLKKANVPKGFDLLVVDTEGNEEEVIKSFDLSEWKPKVVIVELVDKHESFQKFSQVIIPALRLRKYIKSCNYSEFFCDESNTIFVLKENNET